MAEDVVIPEALVPYVAMGLRVALWENKSSLDQMRNALSEEGDKMVGAIRMGIEGQVKQSEELRAEMIRAFRHLPDAIRPRDDLME